MKQNLIISKLLADNIYKARTAKRMTQQELAEKIDVTPLTISNIERMISFPRAEILEALCEALDLRPYELFLETAVDKVVSIREINEKIENLKFSYSENNKGEESNKFYDTSHSNCK